MYYLVLQLNVITDYVIMGFNNAIKMTQIDQVPPQIEISEPTNSERPKTGISADTDISADTEADNFRSLPTKHD